MTASQLDIPHADDAISHLRPTHASTQASQRTAQSMPSPTPEAVLTSEASASGQYHPWIARVGGRKFVLALAGMAAILALVAFVVFKYSPDMADEQIRLVDTGAKWIVAIVSLFVTGNAAKAWAARGTPSAE